MELSKKAERVLSKRIFDRKNIFILGSSFIALIILSNIIVKFINNNLVEFDCPPYWPMSEFYLRAPDLWQVIIAAFSLLLFLLSARRLFTKKLRIPHVILTGIVFILATNITQGWEGGFVNPISGGGENGIQCYHDATRINDPYNFFCHFEHRQPGLFTHSRTHPPGAVLLIYYLIKILGNPGFISIFIAVVSVVLSSLFLYGVLSRELGGDELSVYVTFLFMLIPSIQIYYAASIDAVISSFMLGTLFFFLHRRFSISVIGSIICLFTASLLTFGFVFILPVMFGYEILRRGSASRSILVLSFLALLYFVIYAVSGFNYVNSFLIAASLENPNGFMLLSDPASYIFTRLEGIFEIILFFGPFLTVLMIRGMNIMKRTGARPSPLTILAVSTLLAMFVTGTFRTGETARVCLFIYPYLLLPVASHLSDIGITQSEKTILASLVFTQTVFMQLFGTYFW